MPMSGPIVRSGATPEYSRNWDAIFKKGAKSAAAKSTGAEPASKATTKTAAKAKKKAPAKKAAKSTKKKAAKKK